MESCKIVLVTWNCEIDLVLLVMFCKRKICLHHEFGNCTACQLHQPVHQNGEEGWSLIRAAEKHGVAADWNIWKFIRSFVRLFKMTHRLWGDTHWDQLRRGLGWQWGASEFLCLEISVLIISILHKQNQLKWINQKNIYYIIVVQFCVHHVFYYLWQITIYHLCLCFSVCLTSQLASASDLLVPYYVSISITIIIHLLSVLFQQVKENKAMSLSVCYWGWFRMCSVWFSFDNMVFYFLPLSLLAESRWRGPWTGPMLAGHTQQVLCSFVL